MPPPPTPPHDARSVSPTAPDSPPSPSASPNSSASVASPPAPPEPTHACQWEGCDRSWPDPEALYLHLCNDHIGRKSTNNLCLTCKWKDCNTSCAKRDHITSHLRVHTPLKPHVCEICQKSFKRPQDLKKHEKIHTEEHHVQHKHSKAVTVSDPDYVSRVRGYDPVRSGVPSQLKARGSLPYPTGPVPGARTARRHHHSTDDRSFGLLPTPSPELLDGLADEHIFGPGSHAAWDPLHPAPSVLAGAKRGYDTGLDDFFTDVKKRRVSPTYNSHMAERLNSLAAMAHHHAGHHSGHHHHSRSSSFNPTSINVPIRSEQELVAFNEFMLALGRDVVQPRPAAHAAPPLDVPADYFDSATLRALGLTGLPGLPPDLGAGSAGYPYDAAPRTAHAAAPSYGASAYPSLDELAYPSPVSSRAHATPAFPPAAPSLYGAQGYGGARGSPPAHMHGTPPLDMAGSPHSHSSLASTPPALTPPSARAMLPGGGFGGEPPYASGLAPDLAATLDLLRPSRGGAPVPHLSPADFSTSKTLRTLVPLQSAGPAPGAPRTLEPRLPRTLHRGPPARLTAESASGAPRAAPPLLRAGADGLVLAPLQRRGSDAGVSSASDSDATPPPSPPPRLPGVRELSAGAPAGSPHASPALAPASPPPPARAGSEEGELARGVERIRLDERRAHAELIRALLVRVNAEYAAQRRARDAPMDVEDESEDEAQRAQEHRLLESERGRDVEMTAA